jgi:hypothetical protein
MATPLKLSSEILLLLLLLNAAGCSSSTGYVIGSPRNGRLARASDIQVVDFADPQNYQVIGRVHSHSRAAKWLPCLLATEAKLLRNLKREAALLQAEVIFDLKRYSRSQFEWQEEHLMGTAAIILKKEGDNAP